jgi:ribonuclease HII
MSRKSNIFPFEGIPKDLLTEPKSLIAGVDEVGRGSLFGPVFSAVVMLPLEKIEDLQKIGVKDSKKLTPSSRKRIFQSIKSLGCIYRLGYATAKEIDQHNILQASLLSMFRAINKLPESPDHCLVDGKFAIPKLTLSQQTLIKGDAKSPLIGAASIIAKIARDELINRLASKYPQYALEEHKGYATSKHCEALKKYGPSIQHRFSFSPVRTILSPDLIVLQ